MSWGTGRSPQHAEQPTCRPAAGISCERLCKPSEDCSPGDTGIGDTGNTPAGSISTSALPAHMERDAIFPPGRPHQLPAQPLAALGVAGTPQGQLEGRESRRALSPARRMSWGPEALEPAPPEALTPTPCEEGPTAKMGRGSWIHARVRTAHTIHNGAVNHAGSAGRL